ncbi:metallophosphoesterase family protein [Labrys monachus]|uniref:Serine/threonine protein phosphatase 1 n=1 Tax=Labrys monachus TaxID=217067 RepID=A0ABU0F867_9HYPH|nr:metallophosphoesterase family protein [Labrys monachus]MDQ0390240.1 serine/threonine protein phosphatase 1 [Labrys monachus]
MPKKAGTKLVPFPEPPAVPPDIAVVAIGDVHGRLDLLVPVLDRIERRAAQTAGIRHIVVSLGDLIDRGPDSSGVIERMMAGVAGCDLVVLRGNHEDALLGFLDEKPIGDAWRSFFGAEAFLQSYGIASRQNFREEKAMPQLREDLLAAMPQAHIDFLRSLPSHAVFGDYFFVHAGVRPGVSLAEQEERDLVWIRDEFLNSKQRFEKKIVHGHTPVRKPDFNRNRINLDTKAYASGKLTAALFEGTAVTIF